MKTIRIISWNVAGMRAAVKKGLWDFMNKDGAEIYCFQETKATAEQVPSTLDMPKDYFSYFNSAKKAGYSGVATFTRLKPKEIINGMSLDSARDEKFNGEGRVVVTKFEEFTLLNVYFPNGKQGLARLDYKMEFYDYFLNYINKLRDQGEKVIFCGDVNTAHREIDLARPKENELVSGFLKIEREWMDKLVNNGWVDTFRWRHPEEVTYSWWSQRSGARKRNVGWRIDYFFVDEKIKNSVKKAFILEDVLGSDHAPVGVEIEI
ncbi:exodeoxyribonuclease III [Patescibacteria group bacterium]|nr:exodeoxyribonuclease III [Patescibacteria group bacterium]